MCNSLLSEHVRDKNDVVTVRSDKAPIDESPDTSSCCGKFGKRFLHTAQVVLATHLVIVCFLAAFLSGITFEVDTASVSNLIISPEADALQFWSRTNEIGLSVVEFSDAAKGEDDYQEVEDMYIYSSIDLNDYNCANDEDCENTIDDLDTAWNTLVVASSLSAVFCIMCWLLAAPRNFYSCFFKTKVYERGLGEEKPLISWFVQPVGLTYLLTVLYAVVFGVQFLAFFKYMNQLPSNEEMYDLSLHFLNNDPTLCSISNPCEFSFQSVDFFHRNVYWLLSAAITAVLVLIFVVAAHRLKLRSIRWSCLSLDCLGGMSRRGDEQITDRCSPVSTDEGRDLPVPTQSQLELGQSASEGPSAVVIPPSEVQLAQWTEVDLKAC